VNREKRQQFQPFQPFQEISKEKRENAAGGYRNPRNAWNSRNGQKSLSKSAQRLEQTATDARNTCPFCHRESEGACRRPSCRVRQRYQETLQEQADSLLPVPVLDPDLNELPEPPTSRVVDGVAYEVLFSAGLYRKGLCPGLSADRASRTLGLDESSDAGLSENEQQDFWDTLKPPQPRRTPRTARRRGAGQTAPAFASLTNRVDITTAADSGGGGTREPTTG
jgi:hypothetical protein